MRTTIKHETYKDLHTALTVGRETLQEIKGQDIADHYILEEGDAGYGAFLIVSYEGGFLTAAVTLEDIYQLEVFTYDPHAD